MTTKPYTGVGARLTPPDVLRQMETLGQELARLGYTLRSGGAKGADVAFEIGCDSADGPKEIYLPSGTIAPEAFEMASRIHEAWGRCNTYARQCHARNCHQVLGAGLDDPSRFLICWTEGGQSVGGTRTAIELAKENGVPVFNLGLAGTYEKLLATIRGLGKEGPPG